MTIDRDTAASALADIDRAEQRTTQAVFYGIASSFLILWGLVTAAGYVWGQFCPRQAGLVWPIVDTIGFIATLVILRRKERRWTGRQRGLGWRLILAQVALIVFGLLVVGLLGPFDGRKLDAFWPLLFMLGYVLAGLWVGRFFAICGCAIVALTLAGYWWSGPWFALWMAIVDGGGLLLGGLWLRRKGADL